MGRRRVRARGVGVQVVIHEGAVVVGHPPRRHAGGIAFAHEHADAEARRPSERCVAAGLAVVIAATWFIRTEIRSSMPQEVVDTYDDPKMAFEETKKALLIISKSFGTAEAQTRKINMFNEAQEEIQGERDPEL